MGIIFNRGFVVIPNMTEGGPNITPTPTITPTNTPTPTPTITPTPTPIFDSLLMENGEYLLQENNSKIIL